MLLLGEFGIVYKGCLTGQYTDDVVAIKTLKGELMHDHLPMEPILKSLDSSLWNR